MIKNILSEGVYKSFCPGPLSAVLPPWSLHFCRIKTIKKTITEKRNFDYNLLLISSLFSTGTLKECTMPLRRHFVWQFVFHDFKDVFVVCFHNLSPFIFIYSRFCTILWFCRTQLCVNQERVMKQTEAGTLSSHLHLKLGCEAQHI